MKKLILLFAVLFSVTAFSQETTARIGQWTYLQQNETVADKEFITTDAWFVLSDYNFSIVLIEESTGDEALLTFYDKRRFSIVFKDFSAIVGFYYILE